ncbi:LssY C-terminal domain-containing protein [Ferrimonas gelatinilytica]|uniref:LssY C-terminal domain-containing protein n=1 Tax=Ferrimonas gelatinilytica TaxID=1255257 RepID=UPI0031E51AFE
MSAVVLSAGEALHHFQLPMEKQGIQPIWISIRNGGQSELVLQLLSVDPDYFAPSEVAWRLRKRSSLSFEALQQQLLEQHIPVVIPAGQTLSGFVFTNEDPGAKAFSIELFGEQVYHSFEFAQLVPGLEADFVRVDFEKLYPAEQYRELDREAFRQYLQALPCCTLGGDQRSDGDPLNLVIVGDGRHLLATLVRRGWDLTETLHRGSAWRTVRSSLFGAQYRTSPVSPLYLFDRAQDFALQKTRSNVDERNHLRLWLAPVTVDGQPVWLGQISRDIGIKFSSKTLVTHKIDPVIDEARLYITLDLVASRYLAAVGYVEGVGRASWEDPKFNYTKDPYFTDGLRVVLFLAPSPTALGDIDFLSWATPGL